MSTFLTVAATLIISALAVAWMMTRADEACPDEFFHGGEE